MQTTLAELADLVAGEVVGDAQTVIHGFAALDQAQPGELTFIADRKHASRLAGSKATAVVVQPEEQVDRPAICVDNPYVAFLTLLNHYFPPQHPAWGIDPKAVLASDVTLGKDVNIGPYAVIEQGCRLGDRVVVYPGTYIGADCVVGDDCVLYAHVSLYARAELGERVVIHSGAVIGADGFGFYPMADGSYRKIPQVGRVVIGDAAEIGANTCLDRAMLGDTVIADGVKLDNLIQIGHNTTVGAHSVVAAQTGLSGSVRIGRGVRMGGQVGIADHTTIGDGVAIGAQSGIGQDVEPGATVQGSPAISNTAFKRRYFYSLRLGELFQKVRQLQKRLTQLENQENNP
ncbi:UDP-3-O-(3-hydroxymyristoyl)glucosamine N-acyltransferase [Candidatus Entotheonella palauensis]|uniref:UDP-3-O-(3-hydroxymyristoyl)glucosamine N-acyltransferase n=1 Tax=Candidatus Entotheonella palauensis TaxID=93172 RepID=UPI0021192B2C|nr:UDP-3-O-(3-hydroxymyristoyl)glucosamine N-acyltransferase [Candidatus Entotheonella palauensis]